MSLIFLTIVTAATCMSQPGHERVSITASEMMINIEQHHSREIAYTNKKSGVFYTETNSIHRSGWQGWRIMSTEIMEDYKIMVDGRWLRKEDASAAVYPHQLIREYAGGIQETFTFLDSINALVVELENLDGNELSARAFFTDSHDPNDYEIGVEDNILLIAKRKHLIRNQNENYPVWIGITIANGIDIKFSQTMDTLGSAFSPANCQLSINNSQLSIIVVAGDTKSHTISLAKDVAQNYPSLIKKRKKRMEDLLNYSYVRTDNKRFDKALYWAKISMDALIMNQRGKGIFAGLPWFDNYWGRDSFISLPGATLVTGNFKDAKEILQSFAAWQDTNPNSTNYGRIPNLVTTNSISYNTADGTPRFISALNEFVYYSGDTAFAREMYPVVKRSIEGTIKYHMDSLGFLTHGDAETWMDAVGPDGPWSPRGNRAVDIQALWWSQLSIGRDIAYTLGDKVSKVLWDSISHRIGDNFKKYFVDTSTGLFFDHLNEDGTPDKQLRPNQLFAHRILAYDERLLTTVTNKLVYQYGIASLSQDDENFHPYHHYEPYYVPDAAYHNGVVWTWFAKDWIWYMVRSGQTDFAYQLMENMVHQILDRGAVGTISELLDAAPRPGEVEPRPSGAFSQAWSLAGFIEAFYQAFLSVIPDCASRKLDLSLWPRLPSAFKYVDFRVNMMDTFLDCQYEKTDTNFILTCWNSQDSGNIWISTCGIFHDSLFVCGGTILPFGKKMRLIFTEKNIIQQIDNEIKPLSKVNVWERESLKDTLKLAIPTINPNLKCLQPPSHCLLTNSEIKQTNPNANLLYDVNDPEDDDKGTGTYVYPQTSNLKPGSLDITQFTVSSDDKNIYFKLRFINLSNPGWHPEYGFQLTYAAIAVNKGTSVGESQIGMNSNYTFEDGFLFQNVIYIGGGIRVVNDSGKIIAEYIPASGDEKNPLGNANTKLIEFSIPLDLIGTPDNSWRYAVLVGAQDDHGGAGIGEFRSVEAEAKEWVGGGKKNQDDPNVYDVILPHEK